MKKGFTLIELLAVIVILAIIALIATPIILGIINNASLQSKERTSELIGDAVVNAYTSYSLKQPSVTVNDFCSYINPSYFTMDNVEYVSCNDNEAKLKSGNDNYTLTYEEGKVIITLDGSDVKKEVLIFQPKEIEATPEECFVYEAVEETVIITGYLCGGKLISKYYDNEAGLWVKETTKGSHMDVVIPSKIDGKDVIMIGDEAFSITFSDSDKSVFINSVIIPNSVGVIGDYAFDGNLLTSVTLPDSVRSVGIGAFAANYNLSSFTADYYTRFDMNGVVLYGDESKMVLGNELYTIERVVAEGQDVREFGYECWELWNGNIGIFACPASSMMILEMPF